MSADVLTLYDMIGTVSKVADCDIMRYITRMVVLMIYMSIDYGYILR